MNLQEEILKIKNEMIDEFDKRVEALKEEEQEFPQDGDEYWYIDDAGDILNEKWDGLDFEEYRLAMGNIFKAKDQAEFAVEKLKVEAELRKHSDVWNLEKTQYTFSFNWEDGRFNVEYPDYKQYANGYYFDNIIALQDAIETVGKDRIKKYLFGVEG